MTARSIGQLAVAPDAISPAEEAASARYRACAVRVLVVDGIEWVYRPATGWQTDEAEGEA